MYLMVYKCRPSESINALTDEEIFDNALKTFTLAKGEGPFVDKVTEFKKEFEKFISSTSIHVLYRVLLYTALF